MKRSTILFTMVLTCVFITWGTASMVIGQDAQDTDEFLYELTQPGPEIKRLMALEGSWNTAIKVWDGEGDPAFEQSGTAEREWVLGGRYLQEISENPTADGVFMGRGYFGYNRAQGLYEFVWISTEDIEVTLDRGRIDPETNALVLMGGYIDAASGVYIMRTTEYVIESPDRHVLTTYLTDIDGRSYKSVEITYSKK